MHVVEEGVNYETRALFEYWDFYARNVDEAWDFLNWLAQDTSDTWYLVQIIKKNCLRPGPLMS